jgi:hypothetical protein
LSQVVRQVDAAGPRRSWRRRGFHWSATLGFEYRFKPWGGGAFGYRAPSASTRDADEAPSNAAYDMTHYGPFFSLTLHWKQK